MANNSESNNGIRIIEASGGTVDLNSKGLYINGCKIDIDETIKGLKAIQREAKDATKSLKELETFDINNNFKFKHSGRYLVIDFGEPTGEELSITTHCPTSVIYLTDKVN